MNHKNGAPTGTGSASPDEKTESRTPPATNKDERRDPERRTDGTKGSGDANKDGIGKTHRRNDNEPGVDGDGTGIPGFGV